MTPPSRFRALFSDASAERTWARAASTWAAVDRSAFRTADSWARAAARLARARVTASVRSRVPTVASCWPALTRSPTFTSTVRTDPGTLNVTVAWSLGRIVPATEIV